MRQPACGMDEVHPVGTVVEVAPEWRGVVEVDQTAEDLAAETAFPELQQVIGAVLEGAAAPGKVLAEVVAIVVEPAAVVIVAGLMGVVGFADVVGGGAVAPVEGDDGGMGFI